MTGNGDDGLRERVESLRDEMGQLEVETSDESADARRRGTIGKLWHGLTSRLGPVGRLLGWFARGMRWWLAWVFLSGRDGDGRARFSFARAVLNLAITGIAVIGLHATFKAIYFYSTAFEEMVYVTGKQEIETGELYQFGGCTSLPCSTDSDNGKFYLVESSLYFPVLFYPEEDVFANIPQQNGACRVRGYGIYFRTLRWLYKSAQLYQHVVDVSCRPYTAEEIRRSVEGGRIVDDSVDTGPPPGAPVD